MRTITLRALLGFPALVLALGALAGCGGAGGGPPEGGPAAPQHAAPAALPGLRLVQVVSGLDAPTYVTGAPGEPGRLYVVEKPGRIRVVSGGRVLSKPFLDIRGLVGSSSTEQGLLSVAFHPRYASNRLFYVDYTDRHGDTRVVEYQARSGRSPARRRQLLFVDQPYANHNGGQLAFGPDGYLYVGMGDGGSAGDPQNRAQNLSSRLGKLLRRNVDRRGSAWQIAGYGLRNPWRFSFDRATGALYIGDVGQNAWEEIDYTPRSSPGLENYGWDVYEGRHGYEDKSPNPAGRLVGPIVEYSHERGCSVTGGYVYRGSAVPGIRGRYFYGDYCSGTVWSLVVTGGRARDVRRHAFHVDGLSSFGLDARGELYLVSLGGTVYRLAPA